MPDFVLKVLLTYHEAGSWMADEMVELTALAIEVNWIFFGAHSLWSAETDPPVDHFVLWRGAMIFEAFFRLVWMVLWAVTALSGKSIVSFSPVLGFGS